MTTREKIQVMLEAPISTSIVAYRTFLKDIAEELDQYRWHSLEADPTDVPTEDPNDYFIVAVSGKNEYGTTYDRAIEIAMYEDGWLTEDGDPWADGLKVVAWRNIEEFEDGKSV